MKRFLLLVVVMLGIMLSGCMAEGTDMNIESSVRVVHMFQVEQCNAYRFSDVGYTRYIVICPSTFSVAYGR
jgi:hypothetical protein